MAEQKKIGVILGSTRPVRAGEPVAKWVIEKAQATNTQQFELIDLKELDLPLLNETNSAITGKYEHDHTKQWSEQIKQYDGFIIVTSENNHSFPASLKNALDYLLHEWSDKPVAFVGYGYTASGSRAVQHLRHVVNQLRMQATTNEVLISLPEVLADGSFKPTDSNEQALTDLVKELSARFE